MAAGLLALSVDLTLIINQSGVIEKIIDGSKPVSANTASLVGKKWLDTVAIDSQPKVNALLKTREDQDEQKWRQVNQEIDGATSLPIQFSTIFFPKQNKLVAIGIHQVSKASTQPADKHDNLGKNAKELTQLVGKVPLKQIVTETTDIIEKLCILAALDLTMSNRASAAELLGLSRQGLYIKMRRFGIVDSNATDDIDA